MHSSTHGVREWFPGIIQGCQSILGFRKWIYSEQTMAPLDMCDKGGRGKYSTCIYVMHYPGIIVARDHVYTYIVYVHIYSHVLSKLIDNVGFTGQNWCQLC